MREPEFYTLSREFVREHHRASANWGKVSLRGLDGEIEQFKNEAGFELIARALGMVRLSRLAETDDGDGVEEG